MPENPSMKQILSISEKEARKFIIIFYIVGICGFIFPFTRQLFVVLIPYSLLLTIGLLGLFHRRENPAKQITIFSIVYLFGFLVEMLGVNSGQIFGAYTYGYGLGVKVAGTPIIIGLNWLFLVYTSATIVEKLKTTTALKILLGALLLVGYDLALEQVAPKLNMWYWEGDTIPLQNYLAWFVIAIVFHTLFKTFRINTSNPLAGILFVNQLVFFILLSIILP